MKRVVKSKMSEADKLISKIRSREAVPGIIGLGYVGLPLAMVLCENGFRVKFIPPSVDL